MTTSRIRILALLALGLAVTACGDSFTPAPGSEEGTAAACQDGLDNDGDALVDCADPDCQGFTFCAAAEESSADQCRNEVDDDGDGHIDCDDPGCHGFIFCASGVEVTAAACADGEDNDGDGFADCADPDCWGFTFCASPEEVSATACQDGADNDGDGDTDCDDADCLGFAFCSPATELTATACADGLDNDQDGYADCADPDCAGFVFCAPELENTATACQDGQDNDGDGLTDCADPDCGPFAVCLPDVENHPAACQDGQDNDGDGLTDCADPDCGGFVFCLPETELTAAACADGVDNDGDGAIDCDDPDCEGFTFCVPAVETSAGACQDGVDNDGDGAIDCADPDCGGFVFCLPETELTAAACADGADNDGDGLVDCADPDCGGFVFCQPETETSAAACADGVDNDGDGLVDCADPDCGGFVFCALVEETSVAACQDGVDNDGDGAVDCDDDGCWVHGFCNVYNGNPLTDSWGAVWDGIQRPAKTWAVARAECEALGARLPTVTEVYRNNATNGSGDLSDLSATSELWTFILNYQAYRQTVRLSDGGITARAETGVYPFRCVWPPEVQADFSGYACHGAPGSACAEARRFYHVDQWDRPALDQVAATHECAFLNASLPSVEDWTAIIHEGSTTGTWGTYLWAADIMYYGGSPYLLHAIVEFSADRAPFWAFDNTNNAFGSWSWPTSANRFRCLGKRQAGEGVDPTPTCQGTACFALLPQSSPTMDHRGRRAPLWADSQNRAATNRAAAAEVCRSLGGSLPTVSELQELVHAGLPFTAAESSAWLWTASPIYHGNYQNLLVRRGAWANARTWYVYYSDTVSWDPGNASFAFRCVWHQTYQASPISCPVNQTYEWDGTSFSCAARVAGNDSGQANGGGWTDAWENRWDVTERATASYGSAAQICELMGGRLPLPTELYRVRSGGPSPIPNATASYLWTRISSYRQSYNVMLRLSDGAVTDNCTTGACTNYGFRCIWPATTGSAFGSMSCSGSTGGGQEPCSHLGRRILDSADRARLYGASAAEECAFLGGSLTGLRGLEEAIHGGLPNGDTSTWYWLPEAMYAGNFYQAVARWSGVGSTGWYWNNQITSTASLANVNGVYTFRCTLDDLLR